MKSGNGQTQENRYDAVGRGAAGSYYHRDEQLSTALMTGGDGGVENYYEYDAFGILLENGGRHGNRIRYTGQQYDGVTGQYYLRARYYAMRGWTRYG